MPLTCDKPEAFFIRTRERITYYNKGSNNIVVFLTICISYANNCFTL